GDVAIGQRFDDQPLNASERPPDFDLVPDPQLAIGLRELLVDLHLSELARVLRVRTRLEDARDVQPDVDPDPRGRIIRSIDHRPLAFYSHPNLEVGMRRRLTVTVALCSLGLVGWLHAQGNREPDWSRVEAETLQHFQALL